MIRRPPRSTLFPYTTLFRSDGLWSSAVPYRVPNATPLSGGSPTGRESDNLKRPLLVARAIRWTPTVEDRSVDPPYPIDRKSTRLNSSHDQISYAVFCLKKKK